MFFSLSIFKAHMQSSIVVMLFIVYVRKDRMDGWMVRWFDGWVIACKSPPTCYTLLQ